MSRTISLLFGSLLIITILALLWAVDTHEKTVDSLPAILAREFEPLLTGDKITDINIGEIERHAKQIKKEYSYVEEVIIRKIGANGKIFTVYPVSYDLDFPDFPPEKDYSFRVKSITGNQKTPKGIIYTRISIKRTRLFNGAIIGSMLALVVVCITGLYTIRSKDREVRKTTTLLEEKQRELIHLERLALAGQVTANLLHDLKKPVLNIKAESDFITNPDLKRIIQEEADLFLNLIRELNLEGFLRKDEGRLEFLDIEEILKRSLRLVKYAQKNVTITLEPDYDLPLVLGQRHQLIQVFSNIFLNAMQALEGEGSIRITSSIYQDEEKIFIEIGISDDGPGIPYDLLSRIFEPFYSSYKEYDSTGLGLYITRTIVESMGGTISAHSIPKHGSTFTVRLPVSSEDFGSTSL